MFESLRYSKDKEKLKEIMEENKASYVNIDRETRDMLEVVANIKIPDKFKTIEYGKARYEIVTFRHNERFYAQILLYVGVLVN